MGKGSIIYTTFLGDGKRSLFSGNLSNQLRNLSLEELLDFFDVFYQYGKHSFEELNGYYDLNNSSVFKKWINDNPNYLKSSSLFWFVKNNKILSDEQLFSIIKANKLELIYLKDSIEDSNDKLFEMIRNDSELLPIIVGDRNYFLPKSYPDGTSFFAIMMDRMKEYEQRYGRKLSLEDFLQLPVTDSLRNSVDISKTDLLSMSTLSGFDFIHLTDYAPKGDTIYTPLFTGRHVPIETTDGVVDLKSYRDTVHFAVNSSVSSHMGGDWRNKKYAIFTPASSFTDLNQDVGSARLVDFFVNGNAKLPKDTFMLVPMEEVDEIQKANPNIYVVGYKGNRVLPHIKEFQKFLMYSFYVHDDDGIQFDYMAKDGLSEADYNALQDRLAGLFSSKLGKPISAALHDETFFTIREDVFAKLYATNEVCKILRSNKGAREHFIEDKRNALSSDEVDMARLVELKGGHYLFLDDIFVDQPRIIEFVHEVEKKCNSLGFNAFQFLNCGVTVDGKKFQTAEVDYNNLRKRIVEKIEIEEFLGADISSVFEGDLLTTNIKRVEMIISKMEKENLFRDANAIKVFNSAVNHMQEDYMVMIKTVPLKKHVDKGFDINKYKNDINSRLKGLNINCDLLEQKNLGQIILKEKSTQSWIDKNIPNQGKRNDIVLDTVYDLYSLLRLIYSKYEKHYAEGLENIGPIFRDEFDCITFLCDKLGVIFSEEYITNLRQKGVDIREYLSVVEVQLNFLGISIDNLLDENFKNRIESAISKKMEANFARIEREAGSRGEGEGKSR